MDASPPVQPDDIEALKSALIAAQLRADEAEAKLAGAQAHASAIEAAIAHLTLEIAKLKRERFGSSSERTARLLDQLEFQLAEHEETATEDEIKAEMASPKTTTVRSFTRKRPARREFPAHLPRKRVVVAPPISCHCCGGQRLSKLGETTTDTLEEIPRRFFILQTVREKFTCRDCEAISQSPAPFHATPRGWGGPNFLAGCRFRRKPPPRNRMISPPDYEMMPPPVTE